MHVITVSDLCAECRTGGPWPLHFRGWEPAGTNGQGLVHSCEECETRVLNLLIGFSSALLSVAQVVFA